jgi:hypothetical protein
VKQAQKVEKSLNLLRALWTPNVTVPEGINAEQLEAYRGAINRAAASLAAVRTNCHACKHWDIDSCEKYGTVPVEFQQQQGACPDWRFDGVPW